MEHRKKKLLLIGNVTIHTYNYYHLVERYFDEICLVTDEPRPGENIKDVRYVSFSYRKPSNFYKTITKIREVIRQFKPDVIHVHQANSVALYATLAARSFKIPMVLTTWGSDILLAPEKNPILKSFAKYCIRQADVVTADAEFLGEAVVKLYPPAAKKLVIANFGIEIHDEIPLVKENIIYSNRLHKKLYNIDQIIRAFKKLEDTGRNTYRLVIAATGEDTEALKKLAHALGLGDKVEFTGWLGKEANIRMYARSKIYVTIPDSDATSISLLEAMYYGCYPVVSPLPSKNEWITEGINGQYYAGDLDFVLDLKQQHLDEASAVNRDIILKKGTVEIAYQKFTKIYDDLIK